MTPIARLLEQKTTLCLHAFEQTGDVNEAHFLVHDVMAQASSRVGGADLDLALAMTAVLDARASRLFCMEAPA